MAKHLFLCCIILGVNLLGHPVLAQKAAAPAKGAAAKPIAPQTASPTTAQQKPASTQPATPYPITPVDSAIRFADSIFHTPTFLYQQVQPDIPEDIQSILIRFNNALANNRQWFQDYKAANAGQTLPYNQRFGITTEEYKKLQNLEKTPPQLVPVDTMKVAVLREGGYIRFHTDGDIHLFDYLQIDLKSGLVVYGGDTIPLIGYTVTAASSPYGQWQGYTWRLEKADVATAITTNRVTARVVEINMGLAPRTAQTPADPQAAPQQTPQQQTPQQTPQSGTRIFLRLKYQDMRDGAPTANLELVGYLL